MGLEAYMTPVGFKQEGIENRISQLPTQIANKNPVFSIRPVSIKTQANSYGKQNALPFSQKEWRCLKSNSINQAIPSNWWDPQWRIETIENS